MHPVTTLFLPKGPKGPSVHSGRVLAFSVNVFLHQSLCCGGQCVPKIGIQKNLQKIELIEKRKILKNKVIVVNFPNFLSYKTKYQDSGLGRMWKINL